MRIRIDFAEAFKFINEELIPSRDAGGFYGYNAAMMDIIGDELQAIICDDYFNGAELACRYMGFSVNNEYFEFELMPN